MTGSRIGLIGASFVAADRMLPAFHANSARAVALHDSDESRFQHWHDHGLELITDDLDQVLAHDVDAVYISSRNAQHAEHAVAAARAGKHVLLEKPMALTLADADAVIDAADRAGVVLAVNHHLPGSPLHSKARRLVRDGRIGKLCSARVNHAVLLPENLREWRLASTAGGGVVFDITVHDASVLNALFATRPRRVTALGASQATWNAGGSRDSVMTVIEYDGDDGPGLAQTHDSFAVCQPGTSMEIHGEDGAIVIGDAMTQEAAGTVTLHTTHGVEEIEVDCSETLYSINVRAFLAATRGEGRPTCTGEEGRNALLVALGVERALATGAVVDLRDLDGS
jgi:1,5-anhydro-D-fructose reductase (1,5-anhydro-D-mannitol-forming)